MNISKSYTITLQQAYDLLQDLIDHPGERITYLFEGEKGVGKTTLARTLASHNPGHLFAEPIDLPTLMDGGIWMPALDHELCTASEYPNDRWGLTASNRHGVDGARPVICMVDEVGKGTQGQQTAVTSILREWRIGPYFFPTGSVVFGATNLSEEGLGDNMKGHLRNGLTTIRIAKPDFNAWAQSFAIPQGLDPYVIAACRLHPEVFHSYLDYREGGAYAGKKMNEWITDPKYPHVVCATPRSLHMASKILQTSGTRPASVLEAALHGAVGSFAQEIMEVKKFGDQLPDFADVVADPAHCPLPKQPTAQILCTFKLINSVKTRAHADAVTTYVKRMSREMQIMFASSCCNAKAGGVNALFGTVASFSALCAEHNDFF